jgi:hypothetical protein
VVAAAGADREERSLRSHGLAPLAPTSRSPLMEPGRMEK